MRHLFTPTVRETEPSYQQIYSAQGIPGDENPSEKVVALCSRAVDMYRQLGAPRGVIQSITVPDFSQVYRGTGLNESETPLKRIYPRAQFLALMAFTLGEAISREITRLFDSGDFALGSMLDTVASEAADTAARVAERWLKHHLMEAHPHEPSPVVLLYSPGYCGWHISAQKKLFEYLRPSEIDIALNPQFLMIPLKSISGVLVAGAADIHFFKNDFPFCGICNHLSCRKRIAGIKKEIRR